MSGHEMTLSRIVELAKAHQKEAKAKKEFALKTVPADYHLFLTELQKEFSICSESVPVNEEARQHGIYSNESGTFVRLTLPYLSVDGRVLWARNEHKALDKKLDMTRQISGNVVVFTVTSEIYGTAMGSAVISNAKNYKSDELQSVETAALGRALGFLGYGLLGTDETSIEEIKLTNGLNDQEKMQMTNANHPTQYATSVRVEDQQQSKHKSVHDYPTPVGSEDGYREGDLGSEPLYQILSMEPAISQPSGKHYLKVALQDEEGNQFDVVAIGSIYSHMRSIQIDNNKWYKMRFDQLPTHVDMITHIEEVKISA